MAAPIVSRGAGVTVQFRPPIEFILRQAGAFRRELLNLQSLWDEFKPVMRDIEEQRFATEGHGEWPPLAESTLRQKAARGYPPDPLIRTRALYDSLVDPGRAAQTTARTMVWGTDIAYAGYHQDGGSVAGRPPQREVLDIRVEDRRRLERTMLSWVNKLASRTWGRI